MGRSRTAALCILGIFASHCLWSGARAEVRTVRLLSEFVDFALDAESGAVVALSAASNEAVRFVRADLDKGIAKPGTKVRVGNTPSSVFQKRYRDRAVFAVVCSHEAQMYVISAREFALLGKIALPQSGVSCVTGSINVDDPFLYYSCRDNRGPYTGAVDLRNMRDCGRVLENTMDFAISASGEIGYRRGPFSPSGFEALVRISALTDDKPMFQRLFYDHTTMPGYLPDPFDRFTAVGNQIFSRSLDRNEATLDFVPQCFSRRRPVLVGRQGASGSASSRPDAAITLRAASYNTFSSVGQTVTVQRETVAVEGPSPKKTPAGLPAPVHGFRVLMDDPRDQVVFACGQQLSFIPLADFQIPDEPLLAATLDGADEVVVGRKSDLLLSPGDRRVSVIFDEIPQGAAAAGTRVTWTPAPDQVGPSCLIVTLKHGTLERTFRFDFDVVYPSVPLPFAPSQFALTSDATKAVVWEGPPVGRDSNGADVTTGSVFRLAIVDLESGALIKQRAIGEPISRAFVAPRDVLLTGSGSPRCEVLRLDDLERRNLLVADGPISEALVVEKLLLLRTEASIEVYDLEKLQRVRVLSAAEPPQRGTPAVLPEGLFAQGILFGFDLKPRLWVDAGQLPTLAGADEGTRAAPYNDRPREVGLLQPQMASQSRFSIDSSSRREPPKEATVRLDELDVEIALKHQRQHDRVAGSTHTWRTNRELALIASGASAARQVLLRRWDYSATAESPATRSPLIQPMPFGAAVVFEKRLYRWDVPLPAEREKPKSEPLQLALKQSAMSIDVAGKTVLDHEVRGGVPPITFTSFSPFAGVLLDPATGTITIDGPPLIAEISHALERYVVPRNHGEPYVETLKTIEAGMMVRATEILGRKPKGPAVALPIRLQASDATGASDRLTYYVLAEASEEEMVARLQKLDEERRKTEALPKPAPRERPRPAGGSSNNSTEALRKRLDSVEQRLDLITRQLNEVLRKFDEREP